MSTPAKQNTPKQDKKVREPAGPPDWKEGPQLPPEIVKQMQKKLAKKQPKKQS